MDLTRQHTLRQPAICAGVALHSGAKVRATLKPAAPGTGIVFRRTDLPGAPRIEASALAVADTRLCTVLDAGRGAEIATVEHLMAAAAGLHIDNLIVDVDGPELPILDGSSAMFCALMLQAGIAPQAAARREIELIDAVEVRDGTKWARLEPGDGFSMEIGIDFASRAIGRQTARFVLEPGRFAEELAFARTFGFARDVEALRKLGLARGGSLDNAIVVDGDDVMNPEGLRAHDEFVRHKLLDALGDLWLAGAPIRGRFRAEQTGHALNNALVRKLLDTPSAWRWRVAPHPAQAVEARAILAHEEDARLIA